MKCATNNSILCAHTYRKFMHTVYTHMQICIYICMCMYINTYICKYLYAFISMETIIKVLQLLWYISYVSSLTCRILLQSISFFSEVQCYYFPFEWRLQTDFLANFHSVIYNNNILIYFKIREQIALMKDLIVYVRIKLTAQFIFGYKIWHMYVSL